MGKSTISMAILNSKLLVYQRVFPLSNGGMIIPQYVSSYPTVDHGSIFRGLNQ